MKGNRSTRVTVWIFLSAWAAGCAHSVTLNLVDDVTGAPVRNAQIMQHRYSNNYFSNYRRDVGAGSPRADGSVVIGGAVSSWDNVNVTVRSKGYWAAAVLFRGKDEAASVSPWTENRGVPEFTGIFHDPQATINGSFTVRLHPLCEKPNDYKDKEGGREIKPLREFPLMDQTR